MRQSTRCNPISSSISVTMAQVRYNFTAPKQVLEIFRAVCQGQTEPHAKLCKLFDEETAHGQDMSRYSACSTKQWPPLPCSSAARTRSTCLLDGGASC
jgi:hypothetical protein